MVKFLCTWRFIPTLGTKVTHRPETILEGFFMNYVNVILANLSGAILMNRSSQWKERMKTLGRCLVITFINKTEQFQFKQIMQFQNC